MNFTKYFSKGLRNTLRVVNGINFSYKGPWTIVADQIIIDEWHVGDFMSADYTISVDFGSYQKEIIKCLVAAGPYTANVTVYGRTTLDLELITISANVDSSRLFLKASPSSPAVSGSKLIFSATYYQTINELTP